jgi:hypothetical protein
MEAMCVRFYLPQLRAPERLNLVAAAAQGFQVLRPFIANSCIASMVDMEVLVIDEYDQLSRSLAAFTARILPA